MFTYTRMFNTCVVPGEECDEMVSYPPDAKHILVLRNNCMWAVQVIQDNGDEVPLADLLRSGLCMDVAVQMRDEVLTYRSLALLLLLLLLQAIRIGPR